MGESSQQQARELQRLLETQLDTLRSRKTEQLESNLEKLRLEAKEEVEEEAADCRRVRRLLSTQAREYREEHRIIEAYLKNRHKDRQLVETHLTKIEKTIGDCLDEEEARDISSESPAERDYRDYIAEQLAMIDDATKAFFLKHRQLLLEHAQHTNFVEIQSSFADCFYTFRRSNAKERQKGLQLFRDRFQGRGTEKEIDECVEALQRYQRLILTDHIGKRAFKNVCEWMEIVNDRDLLAEKRTEASENSSIVCNLSTQEKVNLQGQVRNYYFGPSRLIDSCSALKLKELLDTHPPTQTMDGSIILELRNFDYDTDHRLLIILLCLVGGKFDSIRVRGAKNSKPPACFISDFFRFLLSTPILEAMANHWFLGFEPSLDWGSECMADMPAVKEKFDFTTRNTHRGDVDDEGGVPYLCGAYLDFFDPQPAQLYVGFDCAESVFKKFNCCEFYFLC